MGKGKEGYGKREWRMKREGEGRVGRGEQGGLAMYAFP